ncbi:hypothetical protein [Patulibacter minatonensis]|uniref:hypothetical protein n=1 Tax=Patulibacter minatonensis TaxID=298163 RepID=UPI00047ABBEC|nr:hypothetical protein [Patulibacter minatonensis]
MRTTRDAPAVRDQIVEVALRRLGDATFDDLFKATTPELLAAEAPWAASTVRYQFGHTPSQDHGRGRLSFKRRDLALAMLEAALTDAVAANRRAAETYTQASRDLPEQRSMDVVLEAVRSNLDAFTPGATDEDVAPRERMYYVALAVCDGDGDAARLLRAARREQIANYVPVHEEFVRVLGRRLRPDRTIDDLANAIDALLDGHIARLRFDPQTPSDWVGNAVVAIFASFTVRDGEEPVDPIAALFG